MKLRNLLFCLCSIVTLTSSAIEPVAQLFIAMPDSLVPSLEVNRRKDLIDLMQDVYKRQILCSLPSYNKLMLVIPHVKRLRKKSIGLFLISQSDLFSTIVAKINIFADSQMCIRDRFHMLSPQTHRLQKTEQNNKQTQFSHLFHLNFHKVRRYKIKSSFDLLWTIIYF